MVLNRDELDRLSDDLYHNRRIASSTYCSDCGYNLRTLPYVYTCPECGNAYNARVLHLKGIFVPTDYEPPVGRTIVAAFWILLAVALIAYALNPLDVTPLAIGVFFLLLGVGQTILILRQWRRFQVSRTVARRMEEDAEW